MVASNSRVFSVFYGDEEYLLDREVRRALRWPDRSAIRMDGADASEIQVVEALGDLPLDGEGTVVVLDNSERVKLSGLLASYVEARDPKDRSSVLVAVYRGAQLSKGWAELSKHGRATAYLRLKPWEKDKIKQRVFAEAAAMSVKLDDEAFEILFMLHAEETSRILNEIRKAAYLIEKDASITKETMLLVCGRSRVSAPWAVSEAAFAKDPRRALRALSVLFQDRGDDALVPVVAALMRQLETFLLLRCLLDQQTSIEAMGTALGIHPYRVKKDLGAVRKHTVPQLLAQMKNLCELEVHVKGPATAKRARVELAVLSLAA